MQLNCIWFTPYARYLQGQQLPDPALHARLIHQHRNSWIQLLRQMVRGTPVDVLVFEAQPQTVDPEHHPLFFLWQPKPLVLYIAPKKGQLQKLFDWPIDELLGPQVSDRQLSQALQRLFLQHESRHPKAFWENQSIPIHLGPTRQGVSFQPIQDIHYLLVENQTVFMRTHKGFSHLLHHWNELQSLVHRFPQFLELPDQLIVNLRMVNHYNRQSRELFYETPALGYPFKLTETQGDFLEAQFDQA